METSLPDTSKSKLPKGQTLASQWHPETIEDQNKDGKKPCYSV
jgi:hypothetical protein